MRFVVHGEDNEQRGAGRAHRTAGPGAHRGEPCSSARRSGAGVRVGSACACAGASPAAGDAVDDRKATDAGGDGRACRATFSGGVRQAWRDDDGTGSGRRHVGARTSPTDESAEARRSGAQRRCDELHPVFPDDEWGGSLGVALSSARFDEVGVEQRRCRELRLAAGREEGEHVLVLLARGVGDGHHPLGEEIAALALRAE